MFAIRFRAIHCAILPGSNTDCFAGSLSVQESRFVNFVGVRVKHGPDGHMLRIGLEINTQFRQADCAFSNADFSSPETFSRNE